MKSIQKTSGFGVIEVILLLVVIGIILMTGWVVYNRQQESGSTSTPSQEQSSPTLEKAFGENGDFGTLQAEGYTSKTTAETGSCGIGEEDCEETEALLFHITDTDNSHISQFINASDHAHPEDSFLLGCLENDRLSYFNPYDIYDAEGNLEFRTIGEFSQSEEETSQLLNATIDEPITLELRKLQYSHPGKGMPGCAALFTTVEILES